MIKIWTNRNCRQLSDPQFTPPSQIRCDRTGPSANILNIFSFKMFCLQQSWVVANLIHTDTTDAELQTRRDRTVLSHRRRWCELDIRDGILLEMCARARVLGPPGIPFLKVKNTFGVAKKYSIKMLACLSILDLYRSSISVYLSFVYCNLLLCSHIKTLLLSLKWRHFRLVVIQMLWHSNIKLASDGLTYVDCRHCWAV